MAGKVYRNSSARTVSSGTRHEEELYLADIDLIGSYNILVDVLPIVAEQCSSCCFHIVNNGKNVNISAIQSPLPLSQGEPQKSYPPTLLLALSSVTCLLNIMALSASESNVNYFMDVFDHKAGWGILQQVTSTDLHHCRTG